ncbi:14-3-3 protein [Trichomonas vaginalis G3]|uniref:14-3-3 protein n=1 Tax=Trichomonas vaginalis (strain ATCC PRA-98 / G3) TaxID=412133 RepID=A2F4K6_TRIV3|nr:protein domain specific binding [Trichomonas vaginalis G3]EAY00162.1 14-3-3 protein [Trichomonas vaginalis G3]KAI5541127.1 protein domain specific binding [Trichomonas vaginalis G3]|eukprot:XP_001313091.1 14-3-3 protein [Trichomonas vaginalis G3]
MDSSLIDKQRKLLMFTAKSLYKAGICDQAMTSFKQAIDMDARLNKKQTTFFNDLVQTIVNPIRAATKQLRESEAFAQEKSESLATLIHNETVKQFEKLKFTCHDVLSIIDQQIIPGNTDTEVKVDMMRLQADLYRYITEFANDDEKSFFSNRAASVYEQAYKIASNKLPSHSTSRLALVLNRAILLANVLGHISEAVDLVEYEVGLLNQGNTELSETSYQQAMIFSRSLGKLLLRWKK